MHLDHASVNNCSKQVWVRWAVHVLDKHFNHTSMSFHWDNTSTKSTHLSTSGAPKRSVFSSSLNSGAWTAKISAPVCTSVYINKDQFQNQRKHKLKRVIPTYNLWIAPICRVASIWVCWSIYWLSCVAISFITLRITIITLIPLAWINLTLLPSRDLRSLKKNEGIKYPARILTNSN